MTSGRIEDEMVQQTCTDKQGRRLNSSGKIPWETGLAELSGVCLEMFLTQRSQSSATDVYVAFTYPKASCGKSGNFNEAYKITQPSNVCWGDAKTSSILLNRGKTVQNFQNGWVPQSQRCSKMEFKTGDYDAELDALSPADAPMVPSDQNSNVLWAKATLNTTSSATKQVHNGTFHFGLESSIPTIPSRVELNITVSRTTSFENDSSHQSNVLVSPKRSFLDTKNLLFSTNCSDLTIYSGEREFPAHKLILTSGSSVFLQMFSQPMAENLTGKLKIEDSEPGMVEEFLRFLYTGTVKNLANNAPGLLCISEKYDVQDLKLACENSLIATITNENTFDRYALAKLMNSQKLMDRCVEKIKRDKKEILRTEWELQEAFQKFPELVFKALV